MRETLNDLIRRVLSGSEFTVEELLWLILWAGLFFATVHLVTMLLTRWGDRHATAKSLIFSILIHLSCTFGVVTFQPTAQARSEVPRSEQRIEIRQLVVEEEIPPQRENPARVPLDRRMTDPIDRQLARTDPRPLELQPLDQPQRQPEQLLPPQADLPDLPAETLQPSAPPQPADRGQPVLPSESVRTLQIEEPTADAQPEVRVPTAERHDIPERSTALGETARRLPDRGTVERMDRELQPDSPQMPLLAPHDPTAFLRRSPEGDSLRRLEGPAPSNLPAETAGAAVAQPERGSGEPGIPRFARRAVDRPAGLETEMPQRVAAGRLNQLPSGPSEPSVSIGNAGPLELSRTTPEPAILRPDFEAVRKRDTANVPSTYQLRDLTRRRETARKYGGTEESERAVELSLAWLAKHQSPEGYWDAARFGAGQVEVDPQGINRRQAGVHSDSGITALAVLAFLGAGYTHEEGRYADHVDRALRWLIGQQRQDGYLGGNATHYARTYCHAMAAYALAEAYGMQSDPTAQTGLREAVVRAVKFTLDTQNPQDGSWRYVPGQKGDMSIFGWQLMALKSAEIAGIPIPESSKDRMVAFLRSRSHGTAGGLASYREEEPQPTPSMTAEALFCKQMLGIKRSNPACTEAVEYLLQHAPRRSAMNLYYWYYGTLAMHQYGGEPWRRWNESIRDLLVAEQVQQGEHAGSWEPRDVWAGYGGRVYSTALAALCLEVYYRFLPILEGGDAPE